MGMLPHVDPHSLSCCRKVLLVCEEWLLSYLDQKPGSMEQAERVASHVHKTFYR